MSQSLTPGTGVTLDCSSKHGVIILNFLLLCFVFSSCPSHTVLHWVGRPSAQDRLNPPEKNPSRPLRSRHSLHPSCPFPGEHLYFGWTNVLLVKICCFRKKKKKLKTVSPPSPSDRFASPKLFYFCFPMKQFQFILEIPHPPIHCILPRKIHAQNGSGSI